MFNVRLFFGLVVAVGAFAVSAAPAFAEFESQSKVSSGKGQVIQIKFAGGGVAVTCQAFEESGSQAQWTTPNGGAPATKLHVEVEKWGKCTGTFAGVKETVKVSACALELKQVGTSSQGIGSILKTCAMTSSICEVKIEAEANKELKEVVLTDSGPSSENLALEPAIKGITTTVSGVLCPLKGTKEGKLEGAADMAKIQAQDPNREFDLTPTPANGQFNATTTTGTVKIKNARAVQSTVTLIFPSELPMGTWTQPTAAERTACTRAYAVGNACTLNVTWRNMGGGFLSIAVISTNARTVIHLTGA